MNILDLNEPLNVPTIEWQMQNSNVFILPYKAICGLKL